MTDSEIFLIDAQHWFDWGQPELLKIIEPAIARICFIQNEYGYNLDHQGYWMDYNGWSFTKAKHEHAMWFSLLMWAVLDRGY